MFKVQFGVKMDDWDKGAVFGNPNTFPTYETVEKEGYKTLDETIKGMFTNVKYDSFVKVPTCCLAWYPNNPDEFVVSRLDGTMDGGEFYILITKPK